MGGSSSSSSSSNTSNTEQRDERISATDTAVVLRLDAGAEINLTDPGAFSVVANTVNAAFDGYEAMFSKSLGLVEKQGDLQQENMEKFMDGLKSEAAQGVDKIIKYGTIIAVGYIAAKHGPEIMRSMKR